MRTHPGSGRKALCMGSHIGTIIDWPMPEARAFIRDLTEHAAPGAASSMRIAGGRSTW